MKVGRHTYDHEQIAIRHWGKSAELAAFADRWETARGIEGHPSTNGDVTIGTDVWVGSNTTILSGVGVGHGALIGADSCVAQDVAPYAIVADNPARLVRHRLSPAVVEQLLRISWWEWSDELVAANVPLLCNGSIEHFIGLHGTGAGAE